jgi:hypothetical protein
MLNTAEATGSHPKQRSEQRRPASGELLIEIAPDGQSIYGHLLDVSPHGFAIRHQHDNFSPGQQVNVVYPWGKVRARLVWVGERDGSMAAGFRTD